MMTKQVERDYINETVSTRISKLTVERIAR
jgi:hypothetical protein